MTLQIVANNFGKWGTSPDDHRLDTAETNDMTNGNTHLTLEFTYYFDFL